MAQDLGTMYFPQAACFVAQVWYEECETSAHQPKKLRLVQKSVSRIDGEEESILCATDLIVWTSLKAALS